MFDGMRLSDSTDLYAILNVTRNATNDEIKSAYRKMVLKYHPDKNPTIDTTKKFQQIQIAYETLFDKNKRAQYDSFESMNNSNQIKNIFMMYQQLIIDVCAKYEIDSTESDILYHLFDPTEFQTEIETGNLEKIYETLYTKLCDCGSIILLKKISLANPLMGQLCQLFGNF